MRYSDPTPSEQTPKTISRLMVAARIGTVYGPDGAGMTDEIRAKAMELLKLQRTMFPKALPARITSQDSQHHDEHHPVTGRFVSNPEDGRETKDACCTKVR